MANVSFKKMVLNELDKGEWGIGTEIAKLAGYKTSSNFLKVLRDEKREFDNIYSVIAIIEKLFPSREEEMMELYIKTLDPNKKSARVSLEYLWLQKMNKLLVELIEKMKNCGNKKSEEWVTVYEIDYKVTYGELSPMEAINSLNSIQFKTVEMKVFSRIVSFYCYHDLNMFDMIKQLEPLLNDSVDLICDEYISRSYSSRISLLKAGVHMHQGNLKEAREHGIKTLNFNPHSTIKAFAALHIGNSLIFESYEKSLYYFELAFKHTDSERVKTEIKRSINFLSNIWEKINHKDNLDFNSNETSDMHEVAHFFINIGDTEKGINLLNKISMNKINEMQKGFHYYLRGKATGKKEYYYMSIKHFNVCGEKYYKKAPLIELLKLGENQALIEALSI